MDRQRFFANVREFIVSRSQIEGEQLKPDTPLVESGIVDSQLITELIIFVEDLLDITIDIDTFRLSSFFSIDTIYTAYEPEGGR